MYFDPHQQGWIKISAIILPFLNYFKLRQIKTLEETFLGMKRRWNNSPQHPEFKADEKKSHQVEYVELLEDKFASPLSIIWMYIKFSACRCQDPRPRCRLGAMRFITTKQAALGSILLADGSDILLGRFANPLANIHTEVPSAASSLPVPCLPTSRLSLQAKTINFGFSIAVLGD